VKEPSHNIAAKRWLNKYLFALCGLVLLSILQACATADFERLDLAGLRPAGPGLRMAVPHITQNDNYSCGTTAIAMAISYYEKRAENPLDQDEVWTRSKSDSNFAMTRGFDIAGFLNVVISYGYKGQFVNHLGLERLKILLSNGYLVVMLIQPNLGSQNTHAVLAVGYNDATGALLVEDPADRKRAFGYLELSDFWKAEIGEPHMLTTEAGFIIYPKASMGTSETK
jgi:hypothetical protein